MPRIRHALAGLAAAVASIAAAASTPAPGVAQEADSVGTPGDTLPSVVLDSLEVTVLRTPIELMEAPFAVSAVDVSRSRRGEPGLAIDGALLGIPGVQVDDRYNAALGERISIRGFGARAAFGVRGIRVLVDGIPATLPDGQTTLSHVDPALLGRVEVIRGPASALYGNASGGVLRLRTVAPPAVGFREELRTTAGSDGLLRLESRTGGSWNGAAYRLSLSRLEYDGFREWSASEHLRADGVVRVPRGAGELRIHLNAVDYSARNPGSLSDSALVADPTAAHGFNVAQGTREEGRQGQLGISWQDAVAGGRLEASAWAVRREIENPIPPAIIDLDRWGGGARVLLRDPAEPGSWRPGWAVGFETELQRDDRRNFENEGGSRGALALDQEETVTSGALFGQVHLRPGDGVDAMAGLRADVIRFEAEDHLVGAGPAGDPDDSGSRTLSAVSPSAGIGLEAAPGLRVYGNVATAFETPTTTELVNRPGGAGGFNPEVEPQRTVSVEFGVKGRLRPAGVRLAYQLAGYRARIADQLIPFEVPEVPGRRFFRNAGSSIHRGIEASAEAALPGGLSVEAAYTRTDARFDEFRTGDAVHDGNRIPGVAPHDVEVAAAWRSSGPAWARLQLRGVSAVPVDDAGTAEADGYVTVGVRIGADALPLAGARVSPFAGVDNLLDASYVTSVVPNAFGGRYFEPGPGRAIHAGVSVAFGGG